MSSFGERINQLKGKHSTGSGDHVITTDEGGSSGEERMNTPQSQVSRSQPASINNFNAVGRSESSPIRETIFSKFARLAPVASSTPNSMSGSLPASSYTVVTSSGSEGALNSYDIDEGETRAESNSSTTSEQPLSSSWLGQVKGKITKTVQEKYSEYKQENELRRQHAAASAITIAPSSPPTTRSDNCENTNKGKHIEIKDWEVSHSLSADGNLSEPCSLSSPSAAKLMSEIYSSDSIKGSKSIENLQRNNELTAPEPKDSKRAFLPFKIGINRESSKSDLDLKLDGLSSNESLLSSSQTSTPVHISLSSNTDLPTSLTTSAISKSSPTDNKDQSPLQSPERGRRRYLAAFPSFQSLRSSPARTESTLNQMSSTIPTARTLDFSSGNGLEAASSAPMKTTVSTAADTSSTIGSNLNSSVLLTSAAASTPTSSVAGTPTKGSLRNRMWTKLIGTSASSTNTTASQPVNIPSSSGGSHAAEPLISVSMKELRDRSPIEDPFSGFESGVTLSSVRLTYEKSSPDLINQVPSTQDDRVYDSEVETGEEIGEDFVILEGSTEERDKIGDRSNGVNDSVDAEIVVQEPDHYSTKFWPLENLQFWWAAALPICVLLLIQILPIPGWVIGFVTGIVIAVPTSAYVTYLIFGSDHPNFPPPTPFIENVQRKVAKRPAIIVQEELERKFVWMNLWPTKKGQYDPLTYDVRRTSTARLMLHGPWIEMRFPKRNLPLRRMFDDVEPKKVEFHDQVEVIDLSNCSIDLLPENLPSKRMWSKKYPIRIRTNTRKQTQSNSESSKQMMVAKENSSDPSAVGAASATGGDSEEISTDENTSNGTVKVDEENSTPEKSPNESVENHSIQKLLESKPGQTRKMDDSSKDNSFFESVDKESLNHEEHLNKEEDDVNTDHDYFSDAIDDTTPVAENSSPKNLKILNERSLSHIVQDLPNKSEEHNRPTSLPVKITVQNVKTSCDKTNMSCEVNAGKDEIKLLISENLPECQNHDRFSTNDPSSSVGAVAQQEGDSSPKEDSSPTNKTFYLFARTGREKEEWYTRFMVAANFMQDWEHQNPKPGEKVDPNYETQKIREQKFRMFMEDYFQAKDSECALKKHKETKETAALIACAKEQVAFLNIYFGRMWHDLHDSKIFLDFLREKITRKLLKVKIAHYFDEVSVTALDLGPKLPQILSVSLPWQDELGLWVNLEIEYNGICQATVETQGIRLPGKDEPDREAQELLRLFSRQAATIDSDEEDSAEEDDDPISQERSEGNDVGDTDIACDKLQPHAGFKARMLDKMLKSDFVAKVAETEWVRKNITSRNITLQLQLHVVKGTLTLNFPPAPSDRIWYGFRTPPQLDIALRPCFGGHSLGKYEATLSTVMKHLVKRLKQEIMKVLVFPNLDDEVLPFMDHISYCVCGGVSGSNSPTTTTTSNAKGDPAVKAEITSATTETQPPRSNNEINDATII